MKRWLDFFDVNPPFKVADDARFDDEAWAADIASEAGEAKYAANPCDAPAVRAALRLLRHRTPDGKSILRSTFPILTVSRSVL